MKKAEVFFCWLLAAATILLAALLIFQCMDIYLNGNTAENHIADGVYLRPVFNAENVAEHFENIRWTLCLWIAAAMAEFVLRVINRSDLQGNENPPQCRQKMKHTAKTNGSIRFLLLGAAIVLIILGVCNGGMHDVLVKAINICTECIGLG